LAASSARRKRIFLPWRTGVVDMAARGFGQGIKEFLETLGSAEFAGEGRDIVEDLNRSDSTQKRGEKQAPFTLTKGGLEWRYLRMLPAAQWS
jgi:hypothetical protein